MHFQVTDENESPVAVVAPSSPAPSSSSAPPSSPALSATSISVSVSSSSKAPAVATRAHRSRSREALENHRERAAKYRSANEQACRTRWQSKPGHTMQVSDRRQFKLTTLETFDDSDGGESQQGEGPTRPDPDSESASTKCSQPTLCALETFDDSESESQQGEGPTRPEPKPESAPEPEPEEKEDGQPKRSTLTISTQHGKPETESPVIITPPSSQKASPSPPLRPTGGRGDLSSSESIDKGGTQDGMPETESSVITTPPSPPSSQKASPSPQLRSTGGRGDLSSSESVDQDKLASTSSQDKQSSPSLKSMDSLDPSSAAMQRPRRDIQGQDGGKSSPALTSLSCVESASSFAQKPAKDRTEEQAPPALKSLSSLEPAATAAAAQKSAPRISMSGRSDGGRRRAHSSKHKRHRSRGSRLSNASITSVGTNELSEVSMASMASLNSTGSAIWFDGVDEAMSSNPQQEPDFTKDFGGMLPSKGTRGRQRKRIPSRLFRVETGDIPQLTRYRSSIALNLHTIYEQKTLGRPSNRKQELRKSIEKVPSDTLVLTRADIQAVTGGSSRSVSGSAGGVKNSSSRSITVGDLDGDAESMAAAAGAIGVLSTAELVERKHTFDEDDNEDDQHNHWVSKEIFSFCTVSRDFGSALMSTTGRSVEMWQRYRFEFQNGMISFYRKKSFSSGEKRVGSICLDGAACISIDGIMQQKPNCFMILDRVSGVVSMLSVEKESTRQTWEHAIDNHIQFCALFPEHVRKSDGGDDNGDGGIASSCFCACGPFAFS